MKNLFSLIAIALLTGCTYLPAVGPSYHPVKMELPAAYLTPQPGATSPTVPYWQRLNDPTLNTLEEKAIAQSLTLKAGWQRIQQARAQAGMVLAGFGPQIAAQGGYTGSRVGAEANPVRYATETSDTFNAALGATWEIDIFGGHRRAQEAANAGKAFQQAATEGLRSSLTAEVARQYFTYRTLTARLNLAEEQISASTATLALMQKQHEAGLINGLSLAQATANHSTLAMQRPVLQSAVSATQFGLESLLGQKPGTLTSTLTNPSNTIALPNIPTSSTLALPSTLLTSRPDVLMAESAVKATTAQIGVATSDLFPKFSLTGSYGVQAPEPGRLSTPEALVWNGGAGFRWALFSTGQILQNIRFAKTKQREAVLSYQQTVLNALADVETALTNQNATQTTATLAQTQAKNMIKAEELATIQHTQGLLNGLQWNQQKIATARAKDLELQTHLQALNAYINLHQSLGL